MLLVPFHILKELITLYQTGFVLKIESKLSNIVIPQLHSHSKLHNHLCQSTYIPLYTKNIPAKKKTKQGLHLSN